MDWYSVIEVERHLEGWQAEVLSGGWAGFSWKGIGVGEGRDTVSVAWDMVRRPWDMVLLNVVPKEAGGVAYIEYGSGILDEMGW